MFSSLLSSALFLTAIALPAAQARDIEVSVGNGVLRFDPQNVTAVQGDTINFVFHPKAHSVTQSSFGSPCKALPGGFDSNLMMVAPGTTALPNYQLLVNDSTTPIWVYCKQQGPPAHCGQGMVFSINAPATGNTFDAFQAAAIASANSTANSTASASDTMTTSAYVTPAAQSAVTVTATVTVGASIWTTTYGSYPGSPPPTPTANPINHNITVGAGGQLAFNPPNISASIGDTVTFFFNPKNHSVTQSTFSKPCVPLGGMGFNSDFNFVDPNAPVNQTTFKITVKDTAPMWGYCAQTMPVDHCGSGMVFSINAVESGPNNFAAFQSLAKQINGTSSASSSATGTGTGSSSSASATNGSKNAAAGLAPVGFKAWGAVLAMTGLAFGVML